MLLHLLILLQDFQLKCPPLKDNNYISTYSCNMATEAAIMAVISLVLTIVNIICIFITATIVLKVKVLNILVETKCAFSCIV